MQTEAQYDEVVRRFNDTAARYSQDRVIHELFEEQVRHTPDAAAVVCEDRSLTYAELNIKANQLARYLVNHGVCPDQLVGVCLGRSVETVVALLAILKAGGAYVPLDPNYPLERLRYMLEDALPQVLLVQEELTSVLPDIQAQVIALNAKLKEVDGYGQENLPAAALGLTAEHLVYVIYTSGSTGRPKGTAMPHGSMVNLIQWHRKSFGDAAGKRVLQFAALSFDVAFQETFSTLCTGGTLVIAEEWIRRDPRALAEFLSTHCIERLFVPPLMLQSLAESFQASNVIPAKLRDVITAGEQLRITPEISNLLKRLESCRLHNHYGPTETHVVTSLTLTGDSGEWPALPPIGQPIANTQVYVLNEQQKPVPVGIEGEIYIGGAGMARGYRGRPEQTAERFIADPFSPHSQSRLYKTGDLGRWQDDGMLQYLGRNDDQLKIRGYRIEPGEIEAQLMRHHRVKEAAVLAREDVLGEKRLVAYFTRRGERDPSVEELRAHLKTVLPDYMVPGAFVTLHSLPLTPNGKLDRRALPAPDLTAYTSRDYDAPQGALERVLAGIWEDLLGVERVGRQDDFFELGGHSLLIAEMMWRLGQQGLSADVRDVFATPTLADLASTLASGVTQSVVPANTIPPNCKVIMPQMVPLVELTPDHIERIVQSVPGGPGNVQDIYPLTPLQEGMLFHHLLNEGGGDTYVLPTLLSLPSREKLDEFVLALQQVINRHDVLRTAILWDQLPKPLQVVYRRAPVPLEELALDPNRDPIEQLKERMRPERMRLDLNRAPMMRLQVAADARNAQCYALLQLHHLAGDHESMEMMLAELVDCLANRAKHLPESVPYRNHVAQALSNMKARDEEAFFRNKLGDIDEPTTPFGLVDVHGDGSQIAEARQPLDPILATRVRAQAQRSGVSAAMLFHAAWALVVAHTSGRDDVVYGTLLSGRFQGTAGENRALGLFINTLPLRLRTQNVTAQELVEQTQRELADLLHYPQASLVRAQRCSGIAGSFPLFSTLLNYLHSNPDLDPEKIRAVSGIRIIEDREWTNYPITLSVCDLGSGYSLMAQTDQRVDPRRIIAYASTALQSLIGALEKAPKTPALALSILPESERNQIIESFNVTHADYPRATHVHQLFETQVQRTPDAIAAMHGDVSLTYAELNGRANQLAWHLLKTGVTPDQLVGICVERGLDMVVGLLGVLKAGAAYLPLDPNYPTERLQYMLRDAAPATLLVHEKTRATITYPNAKVVELDREWSSIAGQPKTDLPVSLVRARSVNLAYVIYTSGSTGEPKGVMLEHGGFCNLAYMQAQTLDVTCQSRVLQFSSPSFDACTWEWAMALCSGACLCLASRDELIPGEPLLETLRVLDITHATLPPFALAALPSLTGVKVKVLVLAGEACHSELVRQWAPGRRLINAYGPTEATVCASMYECKGRETDSVPIGRPIANARIYILDRQGTPVPIGVEGEIYIGGAGVARGYLNRSDLTSRAFVPDPFSSHPNGRMYKTGDLGRWRANGDIEYLGRNDRQVKIRGFRVELDEIVARLTQHQCVKEAVVTVREDAPGHKRLVAYVLPTVAEDASETLNVKALRTYLEGLLPEYMVPSAFVTLECLPLTANGKLDYRALPTPEIDAYASEVYEAPAGEPEAVLASIWQELLQVERVSRQDNFFDLGGHSLLVLQVLARVRESLGVALKVADAYTYPTIQELAMHISGHTREDQVLDLTSEAALDKAIVAPSKNNADRSNAVLLTGGTGFVGRFLLSQLLRDTDVTIYCLVRAESEAQASVRLREALSKWDLWDEDFGRRVLFVPGDLRQTRLGLEEFTYEDLAQKIGCIYHCAASLNDLETYAMAKPANVDGAKELLRLAAHRRPKLVNYVSTLAVFTDSVAQSRVVREDTPIDLEKHSNSHGYAASKWVGEKIFMTGIERGVPCNIFRLGLVWADTQKGRYDELQREDAIFRSCLLSGYGIRNYRYEPAPTPVDYVARAISFLSGQHAEGGGVFHISSPNRMSEGIFERCNSIMGTSLHLLPLYDWIGEMKRLDQAGRSMPAVPLIAAAFSMDEVSFREYQRNSGPGSTHFDCARTQQELKSASILSLEFNDDLIRAYVESLFSRYPELLELAIGKSRHIDLPTRRSA